MRKKILISILVIGTVTLGTIKLSRSFFSDTETSAGNVLQAGKLDLLVNGENNPVGIVNIQDLKPGDDQIINKTLYVDFNPAKIWLHLKDLTSEQGTQTEPEELEEGESPKWDIENYLEYDLIVGETPIISAEDHVPLTEATSCWIPLGQIPGAIDVTVKQSFHFDPSVTNWAQGDKLTFTEEFFAQQITDPSIPNTGTGRVWNPDTKRCEFSCTEAWADGSQDVNQAKRKDGTAVLATRSNPSQALIAQTSGAQFDSVVTEGTFFSLGFGGNITLSFTNPVFNIPGPDLTIFEVTGGTSYPEERVSVEAKLNSGDGWTLLAPSLLRDASFDLGILSSAKYFRITDISNSALFESTADGYDLDGLKIICE